MLPLGLYIHIPWCEKKCPYCDFNSHQAREPVDEARYVAALLADLDYDLELYAQALGDRAVNSIFIGGGTPSLFSGKAIDTLLKGVRQRIPISQDAEVTLEANPGSAEARKFEQFRKAGVNRLSIGVQSFNNAHLKKLGRVHDSNEAIFAAQHARNAGFEKFNIDLMFGLPNQSLAECLEDLDAAIKLSPPHLSCYQLTIEPNTLFHHRPPPQPSDEKLWQMQTALQTRLAQETYQQYEVSAYAKPEQQCLHNLNYWQFGDYLGIGAGAHGKVSSLSGQVERYWKVKHPNGYVAKLEQEVDVAGARKPVNQQELAFEFMLNALRLTDGFSIDLFEQTTCLKFEDISDIVDQHRCKGLLEIDQQHIGPTERGRTMIDSMLQDYLPD